MIGLGIFGVALYFLFIRGWFYKAIIWTFAYIGMYLTLHLYVDGADHTLLTIANKNFSWAETLPACIYILALLTIKHRKVST
jgi:hypothetical protein